MFVILNFFQLFAVFKVKFLVAETIITTYNLWLPMSDLKY